MGPSGFLFRLIQSLPTFWAERIWNLTISVFLICLDSEFLDFQFPRFPKSCLGRAGLGPWAGLGSWAGWALGWALGLGPTFISIMFVSFIFLGYFVICMGNFWVRV